MLNKKPTTLLTVAIISFALLVTCGQTYGAKKITGAFGMKLGDVFDPSSAIGRHELTDGTPMYQFHPKKQFRSFSRYYVMITPKTHKIYSIWGIGRMENDPTCKKEQELVMSILKKKYGQTKKKNLTMSLFDAEMIDCGNRDIVCKCSGFMDVTIDVRYTDRKLEELSNKERIEQESEKLDSSGL